MTILTVSRINKLIDSNKSVKSIQKTLSFHDEKFTSIESRLESVDNSLFDLKERTHEMGLVLENTNSKMNTLIELITPTIKRNEMFGDLATIAEQHDLRLKTVEYTLKKHLKDDH